MRRYATLPVSHLGPWVETHGYLHSVATRLGMAAMATIFSKVRQRCPQRAVFAEGLSNPGLAHVRATR